ncbi:hypothetical protein [Pandoraea terrigena]|uniref:Uncharacterized protein n=1 Tax=Pandoraea terrigena TaxID=2508292 RepID=A0A5E4X0U9_9BURK|nr:hypothetical protein [Pandoraea terrigena]VVE29930.1 hypothetical protein PTE31013_03613 [Pandoraea terrigena]
MRQPYERVRGFPRTLRKLENGFLIDKVAAVLLLEVGKSTAQVIDGPRTDFLGVSALHLGLQLEPVNEFVQGLTISIIQRLQRLFDTSHLLRKRKRIGLDRVDPGITRQECRELANFLGSRLVARSDNRVRTFLDFLEILDAREIDISQRLSVFSNFGQFEHVVGYRHNFLKLSILHFQDINLQNPLNFFGGSAPHCCSIVLIDLLFIRKRNLFDLRRQRVCNMRLTPLHDGISRLDLRRGDSGKRRGRHHRRHRHMNRRLTQRANPLGLSWHLMLPWFLSKESTTSATVYSIAA